MTPEERADPSNGIVLCRNHAKRADDDDVFYTVERLQRWRAEHEDRIREEMRNPGLKHHWKPYDECSPEEILSDIEFREQMIKEVIKEAKNPFLLSFLPILFLVFLQWLLERNGYYSGLIYMLWWIMFITPIVYGASKFTYFKKVDEFIKVQRDVISQGKQMLMAYGYLV